MSEVPDHHAGLNFFNFLAKLVKLRGVENYLEIGVFEGETLSHIAADNAVGVDPDFQIKYNVANGKKSLTLYQGTSDRFFKSDVCKSLNESLDFAFLDGMHVFEFLLRDFYNTEAISHETTLIAIHDCLPLKPFMMLRESEDAAREGADDVRGGWWTGDVWKIIPILREFRPDLRVVVVDSPPTGLVLITNLSPSSTLLKEKYLEIVEKYRDVPNDAQSLEELYATVEIVKTEDILNHFDHSLFFKV